MGKLRKRMSFSRINEGLEMPDLIEVQKRSYQRFLETDLKEVLADASPITNYNGNLELTFTDYSLGEPKNSVERCRERDMTYAAPLNIHVHLYDSETSEIKETDVYMGDFPLMTENGTFVINGADRVIVSQLVRSPGCYYTRTLDKAGVPLYSSQIIPNRGAWLEYETDSNDIIWVRLDRARKLCLTTLLRALGYETDDDIRNLLGNDKRLEATMAKDTTVAEASKDRGGAVRIAVHRARGSHGVRDASPRGARRFRDNRCAGDRRIRRARNDLHRPQRTHQPRYLPGPPASAVAQGAFRLMHTD